MSALRSRAASRTLVARPPRRLAPLAVLLSVLSLALGALPALAGDFDLPVALKWKGKTLGPGAYASVAVDPAGSVHVLYNRESKGAFVLTHVFHEGKKRRTEVVATDAVYGNALAVDAEGVVHALYYRDTDAMLVYARRDAAGWSFETLEPGGLSPSIQVDAQGVVHALHIEGNGAMSVRYLRRTPFGWESEGLHDPGLWFGDSALVLDGDEVHAVFSTDGLPRTLIVATRDAGGVWTQEVVDDGEDGSSLHGSAVLDGEGTLHVAYVRGTAVTHAWRAGSAWNKEDLVTEGAFFGIPFPEGITLIGEDTALAVDPSGRPFLAGGLTATSGTAYGMALWTAVLDADSWTPSFVKTGLIGSQVGCAVGPDGLVHVTTTMKGKIALFGVKGQRLQLKLKPKAAGTITVEPTGAVCDGKLRQEFFPGTAVTLTATPAEGFVFSEWLGACEGGEPSCELVMDGKRKVLAVFTAAEDP